MAFHTKVLRTREDKVFPYMDVSCWEDIVLGERTKWEIGPIVLIISAVVMIIAAPFSAAEDRRSGTMGTLVGGFFMGLANMNLAEGDAAHYEFEAPLPVMFVLRYYVPDGLGNLHYSGTEHVNASGTKAEGGFVAPVEGHYVFQFLITDLPEGTELRIRYDIYREIPLDEPTILARISLVVGSYLSAITAVSPGRSRRKQTQDIKLISYWDFFTSSWRYWSPALAGMTILAALFILELMVSGIFPRWMETPFDLGWIMAAWGLFLGLAFAHSDWKNLLKTR